MSNESIQKQKERIKQWKAKNKEKVRQYQAEWKEKNKDHVEKYNKQYHAEYRKREHVIDALKVKHLKKYYNITKEDFLGLWEIQDGKCAICDIELTPRGKFNHSVTVDHNHLSGEVRGLLCRACNQGIGCLKDSPDVLMKASCYLHNFGNYSIKHLTKGE